MVFNVDQGNCRFQEDW